MKKILFGMLFLLPVLAKTQDISAKADAYIKAYAAQNKFSGNILIAKNDKIIFRKSAGFASLENHQLVNDATTFRIGSLTKMFTAALVLHAAENQLLSLDAPVSRYITILSYGDSVTIRQLLSHSSGISGNTQPNAKDLQTLVSGFAAGPVKFRPGTKFDYNNFNFILLSYILEKIYAQPFAVILQTKILGPAGMKSSGLDSAGRPADNAATGYTIDPATNKWVPATDPEIQQAYGAGAMYATTEDLLLWSAFIRNGRFISHSLLQEAMRIVHADYGLGWIIRNMQAHPMAGHTGTVRGFNAASMHFPKDSFTVIYTSNFQDMDVARFANNLYALALSLPYEMPVFKKMMLLKNWRQQN
ncbi:MAG: class A beta-lactamase-related serine hydrolase [Chitinophagaceae bacterium]|nr:MAG: class A beta-lactamase-related serine hydrolase [Chitinophagaceae bacterium]